MVPRTPKFTEHIDSDNLPNEGRTLEDILLEHDTHVCQETYSSRNGSTSSSSQASSNSDASSNYVSCNSQPSCNSQNSLETPTSSEECNEESTIADQDPGCDTTGNKTFCDSIKEVTYKLKRAQMCKEKGREENAIGEEGEGNETVMPWNRGHKRYTPDTITSLRLWVTNDDLDHTQNPGK